MITVIARWDTSQIAPDCEFKIYRHLKGAYGVDRLVFVPIDPAMEAVGKEQYATIEDALAACTGQRVFLEPTGENDVGDIPAGDIVLVVGNTQMHNLLVSRPEERYRIDTPSSTEMFGVNAVAIALATRHGN